MRSPALNTRALRSAGAEHPEHPGTDPPLRPCPSSSMAPSVRAGRGLKLSAVARTNAAVRAANKNVKQHVDRVWRIAKKAPMFTRPLADPKLTKEELEETKDMSDKEFKDWKKARLPPLTDKQKAKIEHDITLTHPRTEAKKLASLIAKHAKRKQEQKRDARAVATRTTRCISRNAFQIAASAAALKLKEEQAVELELFRLPAMPDAATAPWKPTISDGAMLAFESFVTAYVQHATRNACAVRDVLGEHKRLNAKLMAFGFDAADERIFKPTTPGGITQLSLAPKKQPALKLTAAQKDDLAKLSPPEQRKFKAALKAGKAVKEADKEWIDPNPEADEEPMAVDA